MADEGTADADGARYECQLHDRTNRYAEAEGQWAEAAPQQELHDGRYYESNGQAAHHFAIPQLRAHAFGENVRRELCPETDAETDQHLRRNADRFGIERAARVERADDKRSVHDESR